MSTTGGYTTTKAKARKPAPFKRRGTGDIVAVCTKFRTLGRTVSMTGTVIDAGDIPRFAAWMQRAAAWCAEGGRR